MATIGQANSQTNSADCMPLKEASNIVKKYEEVAVFIGSDTQRNIPGVKTAVFLNKQTGSYTVFIFQPSNDVACMVSSGTGGQQLGVDNSQRRIYN